jgi:hypothetical protein
MSGVSSIRHAIVQKAGVSPLRPGIAHAEGAGGALANSRQADEGVEGLVLLTTNQADASEARLMGR